MLREEIREVGVKDGGGGDGGRDKTKDITKMRATTRAGYSKKANEEVNKGHSGGQTQVLLSPPPLNRVYINVCLQT